MNTPMKISRFAEALGQPRRLVQNWRDTDVLADRLESCEGIRDRSLFDDGELTIALALIPLAVGGVRGPALVRIARAIRDAGEEGFGVPIRRAFDRAKADKPAWLAVHFYRNTGGEQLPEPRGVTTERQVVKLIGKLADEDTPVIVVDLRRALGRWREMEATNE